LTARPFEASHIKSLLVHETILPSANTKDGFDVQRVDVEPKIMGDDVLLNES
jgi:hypothetical protein